MAWINIRIGPIRYLPFNLAAFLTVAESNVWFTQAVWYAVRTHRTPLAYSAAPTCKT